MNWILKISQHAALSLILSVYGHGASLVIDTFDDGPFFLSNSQSAIVSDTQSGGMLGGTRYVGISTQRRSTTVTAELVTGTSILTFDTGDGPLLGTREGYINIRWGSNPSLSLLGYDAFALTITDLVGVGEVHVGINYLGYGSSSTSVPLTTDGELIIPMSQVDLGTGSLAGVSSIQLVLSGVSADFGASISEFRVIPEPSSSVLLMCSLAFFLSQRRRKC